MARPGRKKIFQTDPLPRYILQLRVSGRKILPASPDLLRPLAVV
jgi:hypothetical protein